jgi:transposase
MVPPNLMEKLMSTSLLYHVLGLQGYQYAKTTYATGKVTFHIKQAKNHVRCPVCRGLNVILKGSKEREWHAAPFGSKQVKIRLAVPRIYCCNCEITRQVNIPFARAKESHTRAFGRYALELLRHMTIQDVCRHLKVGWDRIKGIEKRYLKRHFANPDLSGLKKIAIDEISVGKGHRYMTVVLDLASGAVVFVGKGKDGKALAPFWKRLKKSGAAIEAVATDMSPAFTKAVREALPDAIHVYDHFHVVKLMNEKIDKIRRVVQSKADDEQKSAIKGNRWLLLKRPENLSDERDEKKRLQQALELNRPLAVAYYMKEDLRQFWAQENKEKARAFMDNWVMAAKMSEVDILSRFANTISSHAERILAYYDAPISTGPLEGTNNKIKTLQKMAYGYRDEEYYKLKIMALHRSRYALVG